MNRRELLLAGGMTVAAGSLTPRLAWSTSPTPNVAGIDPLSMVDPEFRDPLESMLKNGGSFSVNAENLQQSRKTWMTDSPTPTPAFEKRSIAGSKGAPDVQVYVINAAAGDVKRPAILHIHGGGFVLGLASEGIPALQRVAREHDCVIVTVDYRLAPETRFPGSHEDNYAALKWLYASANSLGVDPSRIAVMGESAGGGHAAMLAIAARDRGEVPIAMQVLIYPMLDDRTGSTHRVPPFVGAYIWTPASNQFGWGSLLGIPAGSKHVPAGAVPARVEDLTGLPPAFIGVGAIDLFVEEDVEYARRLIHSGVPTELCVVPGGYHGFDLIAPDASGSKAFRASWNAALAKAFSRNRTT